MENTVQSSLNEFFIAESDYKAQVLELEKMNCQLSDLQIKINAVSEKRSQARQVSKEKKLLCDHFPEYGGIFF